ncbi:MAG: acyl-CoA dehydrogenase family protein, partial [Deltaproteobacteria bacterium]|nr:acyl-CoA dehydrogenase family protein [Deltaproteobacteria bacterium]
GGPFGLTQLVHTAFGALPLAYFGTEEQKTAYLPRMASGATIAAFALTEPDVGSDALHIGTTAALAEDGGHYVLNGSKQFTSNSGYASVFITFAKVDGERFAAFLLDRSSPGLLLGEEEKKMGIRGSSTRGLTFNDVRVPCGNVLLEPGKGHLVAFNTLNVGRHRLAAACTGSARVAFEDALRYARNRRQFERPIATFGLVKEKIAEMAIRLFAAESLVYRTAGLLDRELADAHSLSGPEVARRISGLALECSVSKVYASEMLQHVTDEAVQVHGGYGYLEEYPVERHYRDARIYRIFGGTNEINRLIVAKALHRRAKADEGGLASRVEQREPSPEGDVPEGLQAAGRLVSRAKWLAAVALSSGCEANPAEFGPEEELAASIARIAIEAYAMESCFLRAWKIHRRWGASRSEAAVAMSNVYIAGALPVAEVWTEQVLAHAGEAAAVRDEPRRPAAAPGSRDLDAIRLRRSIADFFLDVGKYSAC